MKSKTKQDALKAMAVWFSNDIFFKYLAIGEDKNSHDFCKYVIEQCSEKITRSLLCLNPEMMPETITGKKLIMDVLLEDEQKNLYNLEMQTYGVGPKQYLRFQAYGYRMALKQLERGDEYTVMKPYYQIVFIKAMPPGKHRLVNHMYVKDDDNVVYEYNTLNCTYVYLPVAMEIYKEKGFANMTEFELLCFILAYGPNDDILKLNKRMVNIVMEKYNEMKQNEPLWSWADSEARGELSLKLSLMDAKEAGEKLGEERGERRGEKKGVKKGLRKILGKQIKKKYNLTAMDWLMTLSEKQLLNASDLLFDCDTFQQLQDAIDSQTD